MDVQREAGSESGEGCPVPAASRARAFQLSPVPQIILDPHLRIAAASDSWLSATGLSWAAASGRNIFQLLPSWESPLSSILAPVRQTQHSLALTLSPQEHVQTSGKSLVPTSVAPLDFPEGTGLLVTASEIPAGVTYRGDREDTDKVKEALTAYAPREGTRLDEPTRFTVVAGESEQMLDSVIDSAPVGLLIIDRDGRVRQWNAFLETMTGLARSHILGTHILESFPWMEQEGFEKGFKRLLGNAIPTVTSEILIDEPMIRSEPFYINVKTNPMINAVGETTMVTIVIEDVTDRKQAEEELRQAHADLEQRVTERTAELAMLNEQLHRQVAEREELMHQIEEANNNLSLASAGYQALAEEQQFRVAILDATINAIAEGICIHDPAGQILQTNAAFQRMTGYEPEQYELPLAERMAALGAQTLGGQLIPVEQMAPVRALGGETVLGQVCYFRAPDQKRTCVSLNSTPIRTPDGQLWGAVTSVSDITEMIKVQEQREDWVRTISHDLRGPLTTISGHAQLLRKAIAPHPLSPQVLYSIEAVITAASRMNSMIQDLVDSARLEGGRIDQQRQQVDLCRVLTDLLRRTYTSLAADRLKLLIVHEPLVVRADPDQIERIIVNLTSNALKYSSPDAEVVVKVERVDQEAHVSVIDQGTGIAPDDLPHIFDRFYQTQGPRKKDSVGLGLYITRMLVEAQDGHIGVESQPGKGSTFRFILPLVQNC